MPIVKLTVTIYEKSFDKRAFSKSFITSSRTTDPRRVDKKLAKATAIKLYKCYKYFNKGLRNV